MTRSSGRLERDQLDLSADCVRNHPVLHHPGRRQEREFCDWRRAAENAPIRERRLKSKGVRRENPLSLSETQSCWQLISNWAMLVCTENLNTGVAVMKSAQDGA